MACFGSIYEPSSGWLLYLSKVKYTINKAIVIVTYEISYKVSKIVTMMPLCSSIKIKLVEVNYKAVPLQAFSGPEGS